jgi:uncharacterized protein YkwD
VNNLLKLLKSHFIPHEENSYQPHFLRFKTAAGILALVITIEALYLAQAFIILPQSASFAAIFASVLVDQTNEHRLTEQLGALTKNSVLEKAARMKAEDMAAKGYFSHNSPDGKTPWYWFAQAGYDYAAAGENLAVNFIDSKDVTEAWMHSPAHRANILSGNYTEIGIATAHGVYKGREVVFVVQEFGRPSLVAREAAPVPQPISVQTQETFTPPKAALGTMSPPKTILPKTQTPSKRSAITAVPPQISTTTAIVTSKPLDVSTTTIVAGAETTKLDTSITLAPQAVNTATQETSSKVDALIASPRSVTTTIYLILAAIILLALSLAVFVKVRIQHPHLIANGVLLVAFTLSLVVLNAAIGFTQGLI